MNNNAKFRVFEPFPAYIDYLKRNGILYETKMLDKCEYIEFNAQDRFNAKEDYHGLCGISGYVFETHNGKETVLEWF